MKIIGNNFYSFFAYGACILATIAVVTYNILKKKTNNNNLIILGMSILLLLFQGTYFPNYNTLILLFPLLLMIIEEKREVRINLGSKTTRIDFIIGIILALMFLTKHTVGGVLALAYVLYLCIYDKLKFKKIKWKSIIMKFIGAMSIVIPFIIYLLITGSFIDFIDLCFGGIFDFGSKNLVGTFFTWQTSFVITILILNLSVFMIKKNDFKLLLMGILSLASLIIIYPLFNVYHLTLPLILSTTSFIYSLEVLFQIIKNDKLKKKINKFCYFSGVILFLIVAIYMGVNVKSFNPELPTEELKVYKGLFYGKDYFDNIVLVNQYIKNKEEEGYKVYIMSSNASMYMIPLQRNNNKFDLLLQGNLGYNGEERMLEEIAEIEKPLFLKEVKNADKLNYQESKIIDKYIKDNHIIVDEIENFAVYGKGK